VELSKSLTIQDRKYNKIKLQLLVGFSFAMLLPQVNATELSKKVILTTDAEYNSNPSMSNTNKQSVWTYTLAPQILLNLNDDVNRWYLNAALMIKRNSNENVLVNREDPSLSIGWNHAYETGSFGVDANYSETSSIENELKTSGFYAKTDNTQKTKDISANWQHSISPRLSVFTDAVYRDVSYSLISATLGAYRYADIGSKLTYAYSEEINTHVRADVAQISPDKLYENTDIGRLMVGADYKLNEKFNIGGQFGIYNLSGRQSDTDWQADVSGNYTTAQNSYKLNLIREISASGFGGFQRDDAFKLGWTYGLSEKANLGANYSLTKYKQDKTVDLSNLDFQEISAFYDRELTNHWHTRVSIAHRQLTDASNSDSKANIIGATLIYDTLSF
jgi:hypothetical protein